MHFDEIISVLEGLAEKKEEDAREQCISDYLSAKRQREATAIRSAIDLLRTHPDAQPNEPLTLEELLGMDGEAVYLAADRKWYIVSLKFPGPWGNNVPCGVDMWGAGTSLSLLAKCGVYRRPPKEGK